VISAVAALQEETASYPGYVQVWMKVMGMSFLFSIMFLYSRTGARWIFAALVLNILGLVLGKIDFPDESRTVIGTIVHLVFWPAILWAVWLSTTPTILTGREKFVQSDLYCLVSLGKFIDVHFPIFRFTYSDFFLV